MITISSLSHPGGVWINSPNEYTFDDKMLRLTSDARTDFWQETWYGFHRHSGHAFGFYVSEDFTVQIKVMGEFTHLYDQAGLFIGESETCWVKAGIEFNDDQPAIGSVVTHGTSDWSTGLFPGDSSAFWMRATVQNNAMRIQYSTDGQTWPLLRLCPWPGGKKLFVGVMACSPERAGLKVMFSDFRLGPPDDKPLHDLS